MKSESRRISKRVKALRPVTFARGLKEGILWLDLFGIGFVVVARGKMAKRFARAESIDFIQDPMQIAESVWVRWRQKMQLGLLNKVGMMGRCWYKYSVSRCDVPPSRWVAM
jgi:hypothetical protein